ncbi:hypothetical protein [Flavobacterium rhizosphaerae]|uniref:Uncharacterized protein n=1 Tax=Flavobacterium rhizosphaerae TaxID=3163298 RepID=A0ABW8Z0J9_9FLAO
MQTIINFFSPYDYGRHNPNQVPNSLKDLLIWPFYIFRLCFIAGTTLMLLYIVTKLQVLVLIGFFYTVAAVVLNLLLVLCYGIYAFTQPYYRLLILQKATILLLNIPIAILYMVLLFGFNF